MSHPLVYMLGGAKARLLKSGYSEKHANARRSFAIHAYVGGNGSGKSLALMHDLRASLEDGRPALSTVRLLDYRTLARVRAVTPATTRPTMT